MITVDKLSLYSTKTLQGYIDKFKSESRFATKPCSLKKVREELKKRKEVTP